MRRLLPLIFLLVACGGPKGKGNSTSKGGSSPVAKEVVSSAPVGPKGEERVPEPPQEFAVRVLKAIRAGDIKTLASLSSPEGILLSPDLTVDLGKDVVLKPDELVRAWEEDRVFVWGVQPGSGMPIKMGIREFFKRYLYDRDYLKAPEVATNRRLGRGTSKDNTKEVYPDAVFVEYHFPGTEENGGMDWSSLRVVLKRADGGWKVVALLHDGWTP